MVSQSEAERDVAKYLTTRPAKYLLRVLLRAKYLQVRLSVSIPSYLCGEGSYLACLSKNLILECECASRCFQQGKGPVGALSKYCENFCKILLTDYVPEVPHLLVADH